MIDYLLEAERREALYDQRRLSAKHMQRREEEAFVASEGGNADNYERTSKTRLMTMNPVPKCSLERVCYF